MNIVTDCHQLHKRLITLKRQIYVRKSVLAEIAISIRHNQLELKWVFSIMKPFLTSLNENDHDRTKPDVN